MSIKYYECIYNKEEQTSKYYKEIDSETTVKSIISDWKNDTDLYWQYYKKCLEIDAMASGKNWEAYCEQTKDKIFFDKKSISITVGKTETIKGLVIPLQTNIVWSTSDKAVATVSKGIVSGVSSGSAIITGTTENGQTAICEVTVE